MESFEEMQARHRREQKDLQSRVMQKKKSATKKTRKGVNSECEDMERQVKEKQEQEAAALNGDYPLDTNDTEGLDEPAIDKTAKQASSGADELTESLEKTTPSKPAFESGPPRKRNRAKERLAKRAADQEAVVEEAKKEAASQPDEKAVERDIMLKQFEAKSLVEKTIRPDGHCLFSAIADQLSQVGIPLTSESNTIVKEDQRYKVVRDAAARYMEGHPDDFVPWLDEPLVEYAQKIRETAEWGGHLELLALAKMYNVEICVLQDGSPQNIKPGLEGSLEPEKIWLAYYRHGFGLGEHYNSLRKKP